MIQLLGRATSGNVQKVIFLLEELGLPFERKDYGKQWENTTTPEYIAMNPIKKVPTLIDGDNVIWQSNTILRYLAATHPTALYPADLAQRAKIDSWMDWTLSELNGAYLGGFKDAKKPDAERAADTVPNLAAELKVLEAQLSKNAFVAGAQAHRQALHRLSARPAGVPKNRGLGCGAAGAAGVPEGRGGRLIQERRDSR